MAQPNQESMHGSSEDSTSPNSILVFHHILIRVRDIKNEDEIVSISKIDEVYGLSLTYVLTFIMN